MTTPSDHISQPQVVALCQKRALTESKKWKRRSGPVIPAVSICLLVTQDHGAILPAH